MLSLLVVLQKLEPWLFHKIAFSLHKSKQILENHITQEGGNKKVERELATLALAVCISLQVLQLQQHTLFFQYTAYVRCPILLSDLFSETFFLAYFIKYHVPFPCCNKVR